MMANAEDQFTSEGREPEEYWLSVSDLMSGLMVVFMFIAIVYMLNVQNSAKESRDVKAKLYEALTLEFADSMTVWKAEIDSTLLSIRFREPEVLFESGSFEIRSRFQAILSDFFPRYIAVVSKDDFNVAEVRIEGHTSSEGPGSDPYIYNMELSQDRTRSVLAYCLNSTEIAPHQYTWCVAKVTANGLSSSKLIYFSGSTEEDREASRRVEFRVMTNAEAVLDSILSSNARRVRVP